MLDIYAKINIKEVRKMLYNVGRRIREARKSQNLTQEKLAEHADLSLTCISRLENGKTMVSLETLLLLSKVLNTSLDFILCDYLTAPENLSPAEASLLSRFRLLSSKDQENLSGFLNVMLNLDSN